MDLNLQPLPKGQPDWHNIINDNSQQIMDFMGTRTIISTNLPMIVTDRTLVFLTAYEGEIITNTLRPEGNLQENRIWLHVTSVKENYFDSIRNPMVTYSSAWQYRNGEWRTIDAYYAFFGKWVQFSKVGMELMMDEFFAIPANTSGTSAGIRLKIKKPMGQQSVQIRYKDTPWIESDSMESGVFLADIEDDSTYNGNNNWYSVTGLTPNVRYYFKAFLLGNYTVGINETEATAGGMHAEYTFDSVSGTSVADTSGNNKTATSVNMISNIGVVGSQVEPDGVSTRVYVKLGLGANVGRTICLWLTPVTIDLNNASIDVVRWGFFSNDIYSTYDRYHYNLFYISIGAGTVKCIYARTSDFITIPNIEPNVPFFLSSSTNGTVAKLFKNDTKIFEGTCTQGVGPLASSDSSGSSTNGTVAEKNSQIFANGTTASSYSASPVDQLRIFSRYLSDTEILNIYNNGKGC